MKVVEEHEIHAPAPSRPFWETVQIRYEKIRYGRAGRIIGYLAAFTFFGILIFTIIMLVGYNFK